MRCFASAGTLSASRAHIARWRVKGGRTSSSRFTMARNWGHECCRASPSTQACFRKTSRSLGGRRFDASLMKATQTAWRRLRYRLTLGRWAEVGMAEQQG